MMTSGGHLSQAAQVEKGPGKKVRRKGIGEQEWKGELLQVIQDAEQSVHHKAPVMSRARDKGTKRALESSIDRHYRGREPIKGLTRANAAVLTEPHASMGGGGEG
jgi:hypothetical protein